MDDAPPPPPPPVPPMPPPTPGRPALDLTGALRFGWDVFRATPGPLAAAVVLTYAVLFAVLVVATLLVAFVLRHGGEGGSLAVLGVGLGLGVVGFTAFTVAAQLPTVVLLRGAVDALEGRPVTLARMLRGAGLGRLVGAMLLVILGVLVGYVLLVLPGIVFGVMAGFTLHHMVEDESLTPVDGIRASIETVRRSPWPAIGVIIVTGLVAGLGIYACGIGIVVSAPVALLAQQHGFRQVTGRPTPVPPQP